MWADLTFPPINLYSAPVMMAYREHLERTASRSKRQSHASLSTDGRAQRQAELNRLLEMPR